MTCGNCSPRSCLQQENAQFTMDVYGHLMPGVCREAAERLAQYLQGLTVRQGIPNKKYMALLRGFGAKRVK